MLVEKQQQQDALEHTEGEDMEQAEAEENLLNNKEFYQQMMV